MVTVTEILDTGEFIEATINLVLPEPQLIALALWDLIDGVQYL